MPTESSFYTISVGYCGPSDCCLVLSFQGNSKQYGIESTAWRILDAFWVDKSADAYFVRMSSHTLEGRILSVVWNDLDDDTFDGELGG